MVTSYASPSWYRVAPLKPRLRGHTQIHRHRYRGETWYVQQDHSSGRMYRFSPSAYQIIGKMDGAMTVQELWEQAVDRFGDDAPTQNDIIRLMSQLHQADAMICDIPPDTEELFHRQERIRTMTLKKNLLSPLAVRIPFWDPDRFLMWAMPFVRPLFSIFGALLWFAVIGAAAYLAFRHWGALTNNLVDRVLATDNLIIIWLTFPVVKALHEMGHGFAVKHWGGEVHEVGVMLLVFMPVPYVDATASTAFRNKWQRTVVGAGGMMAELFFASLALFFWLNMEPGYARAIAYNVIIIASVSTLLFNVNPLLRYDGYYILSDLIEVPNLAQRSLMYLGHLWNRYLFGVSPQNLPSMQIAPGEPPWLVFYAIASFCYRILVYFGIILLIAQKFFFIGILLAISAAATMFVWPVIKKIHFIAYSSMLREKRMRAVLVSIILIAGLAGLLFWVPFPYMTRAEGIVWVPQEAYVRAGAAGFVKSLNVQPGALVKKGDILAECGDQGLISGIKILQAQLAEQLANYDAVAPDNALEAQIIQERMDNLRAQIQRAEEKREALIIRSPDDGMFVIPRAEDLPERYVKQGALIGYVLNVQTPTVRVVVPQASADLVRQSADGIQVRLVENIEQTFPARMIQEIPGALEFLPSTILGSGGGGEIPIDPWDRQGVKTLNRLFQFDIAITQPIKNVKVGGRVYVRFDHGRMPLAYQWYRTIRQMFLRRFNV